MNRKTAGTGRVPPKRPKASRVPPDSSVVPLTLDDLDEVEAA
jgi:hypothetical protein